MSFIVSEPPDTLLLPSKARSASTYIDINPTPGDGQPVLLYDAPAILAAIRNLLLCPRGSRGRIFQEDYFSDLYETIHEPFDEDTAADLRVGLYQAIRKWEPRVEVGLGDLLVELDEGVPGYYVTISIKLNGIISTAEFVVPLP